MEFGQVQEGGLNRVVQARLNTDASNPVPVAMPEMVSALVLESDRVEWGWNKGERWASAVGVVTAVAAQNSQIVLVNPKGSRQLMIVERLNVDPALAAFVRWGISRTDLSAYGTATAASGVLDARYTDDPTFSAVLPSGKLRQGANAGQLVFPNSTAGREQFPATGKTIDNMRIVLVPGTALVVSVDTANVGISNSTITWRERPALPNELP